MNSKNKFPRKQLDYYKADTSNRNRIASPGKQYFIELIKGGYLEDYSDIKGKSALDIGCGHGYNLVSFCMMGCHAYGCEISADIVEMARKTVNDFGFSAEIKVGTNINIPYENDSFDILLSSNVIHYSGTDNDMRQSIREYARVLKPGARCIIATTHPDNWILSGSKKTADNIYQINNNSDFRNEEMFFVFNNENEIREYFSSYFKNIIIGTNQVFYIKKTIKNWFITGVAI